MSTEAKEQSPEISVWKKEVDDGESTGRERGRGRESLPPSLGTEEDQRFVLCITMDIRSPILMSLSVWCSIHTAYILWVNKWSSRGNQKLFFTHILTVILLHSHLPFVEIKIESQDCKKAKLAKNQKIKKKGRKSWHFYQCWGQTYFDLYSGYTCTFVWSAVLLVSLNVI